MLQNFLERALNKITPMQKEWTHKISVGEPWNYEGIDGANVIIGKIIKVLDKGALLFESKNELEFDGHHGKYLLLHARYVKQDLQRDFQDNKSSTINGALLADFQENESAEELEKKSKFVVIGGLLVNE